MPPSDDAMTHSTTAVVVDYNDAAPASSSSGSANAATAACPSGPSRGTPKHDVGGGDDCDDDRERVDEQQEQLDRFARHCRAFYGSSLSLPLLDDEDSDSEEKKGRTEKKTTCPDRAKFVLDALEHACAHHHEHRHRLISSERSLSMPPPSRKEVEEEKKDDAGNIGDEAPLSPATSQSVRSYRTSLASHPHHDETALRECGLDDLRHFLPSLTVPAAEGEKRNDGEDGGDGDADARCPAVRRVASYLSIRDAERRGAHERAMVVRRDVLMRLLHDAEEKKRLAEKEQGDGAEEAASAPAAATPLRPRLARRCEIQRVRDILRRFVVVYHRGSSRNKLGCHPLLAGLRRLLETQLDQSGDDTMVARWTFRGTVLTEALCASSGSGAAGSTTGGKSGGREEEDTYVLDAVHVLTSLLVRVDKVDEGDDGSRDDKGDDGDVHLTWEIDPSASDKTLRSMLNVLPKWDEYDAKPTGTVEVRASSNGSGRINADGSLDESEPWYDAMGSWFCRFR